MENQIVRESKATLGFQIISVVEYTSGEVVMYVDDARCYIQEVLALREYLDAYEITYDFDQGWMAGGKEIPYLDCF